MWMPGAVGQTSAKLTTVADADHFIEFEEGWRSSVEMQFPVLERVLAYAGAQLEASRRDFGARSWELVSQCNVAARQSPAWWLRAVLPARIAMPRHCLSLLKHFSTTLRSR